MNGARKRTSFTEASAICPSCHAATPRSYGQRARVASPRVEWARTCSRVDIAASHEGRPPDGVGARPDRRGGGRPRPDFCREAGRSSRQWAGGGARADVRLSRGGARRNLARGRLESSARGRSRLDACGGDRARRADAGTVLYVATLRARSLLTMAPAAAIETVFGIFTASARRSTRRSGARRHKTA